MKEKNLIIPYDTIKEWQKILNLVVHITKVKAALIMHLNSDDYLEVFLRSENKSNPYTVGNKNYCPDSGLYCENVIKNQKMLLVPNATKSELWKNNPDIELNMISYLGLPIRSANGAPFGTICLLDDKENQFSPDFIQLMEKMRDLIENSLVIEEKFWNQQYLTSKSFLRRVLDNIPTAIGLGIFAPNYRLIYVNDYFTKMFGYVLKDINVLAHLFTSTNSLYDAKNNLYAWNELVKTAKHQRGISTEPAEFKIKCKNGQIKYILVTTVVLEDMLLTSLIDITKMKYSEKKLRISERRHRLLADNISDIIWTLNIENNKLTYISPSINKCTGYTPDEYLKLPLEKMFTPDSFSQIKSYLLDVHNCVKSNLPINTYRSELQGIRKDGSKGWAEITINGIYNKENKLIELVGITRDITSRKQMEKKIFHLATHDPLTNLPNVRLITNHLQKSIQKTNCTKGLLIAAIFIDLNGFKKINDTYGHAIGELVLRHSADKIKQCLSANDMASRIGGDEFLIVAANLTAKSDAAELAKKIITNLTRPFCLQKKYISVGASLGISFYPHDSKNMEELIKMADKAMYYVKKTHCSDYNFFSNC
ncbi:sensor domain-containing diguanylate cyclase [Pectinatus sottacetonis]|uniref:sensor domain-containing diguanylate cyclase n=1 Tax=Pectinatus sottacetonis TaxID=1002795 RepID=UPI0018C6154F|nr:diguanylate cyclase [Pectinatus sottacetonis]